MFRLKGLATLTLGLMAGTAAQAAITGPYTVDSDTLHLWHFDSASTANTVSDAVGTNRTLSKQSGATLGNAGFTGFGSAGNTSAAPNTIFRTSVSSPGPIVAPVGTGGAFTYEAMINISTTNGSQQIVAMDNNSNATRSFWFRIVNGQLSFFNLLQNDIISYTTALPTVGDADAFVANEWFHAAVTYNGNENTDDNLKLYWTRVDESRTEANLLATHNMKNDVSTTATAVIGVGNAFRTVGSGVTANLEGSIDEVRLSGVERGAGDFIFVPEPSSLALFGLGGLLIARRRRG